MPHRVLGIYRALAATVVVTVAALPAAAQTIPLSPTAVASGAQVTYSHGIEFVTIPGSTLNAQPWQGNGTPGDRAVGRGAVPYDYRIGRFEVTTAQWVEFFNAAYDRPNSEWLPHLIPPTFWGAQSASPITPGGRRWTVPVGNEMLPVGNISWRMAAMYCNWLHNGRSGDRSAFLNGAYDVSTFGTSNQGFTDQFTRNPGALYWIPSLDEYLMAGHYDPNRYGPGQGGWWLYNNASDNSPAYGPPGVRVLAPPQIGIDPNGPFADVNGSWDNTRFPGFSPYAIPLGAYPHVQSPWGLLDLAGGSQEWTEEIGFDQGIWPAWRVFDGSGRGVIGTGVNDLITVLPGDFPALSTGNLGFRIAAAVPAPPCGFVVLLVVFLERRKRSPGGFPCESQSSTPSPC